MSGGSDVPELVGAVLRDAETLAGQHAALLRAELKRDLAEAGVAATAVAVGAGLAATAGVLAALMLVHRLRDATKIPLWGCYGLVAGACGAVGVGLAVSGVARAARVDLVPRQSIAALREDYRWVKDQATRLSS